MKGSLIVAFTVLAGSAWAQTSSCLDVTDDKDRLACYDRLHGGVSPAGSVAKKFDEKLSMLTYLTVRDEGLPSSLPTAGPAFLGYVKNGDKDGSLIKVSVIATGPALTHGGSGLAPFGSISVYRDLTTATPRSTIAGRLGLRNTFLDYVTTGFAFDTTASVSTKEDRVKAIATDGLLLSNKLVSRALATGAPFGKSGVPYQLVPSVGLGMDRVRSAPSGTPTGTSKFAFAGATLALWPSFVPRLQVNARYQRFNDFSSPSGLEKRRLNYREASIDYYLFNPSDDKAVVQPILSISREFGDDPISGIGNVNRTMIGLKFKVN